MLNKLSKQKKIFIISGSSFLGFILLLFLMVEFTSRPKFCTTCHYMQPFYDSWATSTHKDVPCAECHYAPGFKSVIETKTIGIVHLITYITQFYKRSKPTAEITDASCLRSGCHETRLLSGKEKFKRVYFDHRPHLIELRRGKRLRCTSCHSQIVQGDHMKVTESTCFLCHFKSGPGDPKIHSCTFCHDAPTRENSSEEVTYDHTNVVEKKIACERCHTEMVVGDGAVPQENCYNCHWEQERLNRYHETNFMHTVHITNHKIECQQCHTTIQHKLPQKERLHLLDCSGCHVNSHKAQITLFTGRGGFDAHSVPNPMFIRSITCKGCHVFHEGAKSSPVNGETFKASKKSCENCHGKGFAKLLKQWKSVSQKKLNELSKDFKKANNEVSRSASRNKAKAIKLMQEAKYNIDLVNVGKSVHNVQFADELLRGAHTNIKKALQAVSSKMTLLPYQETSKVVPAECNTCHFGVEVEPKSIFGLRFSHQNHVVLRKQNCKNCHSNDRKHGELIMTKSKCATCHHNKKTEDCSSCHSLQQAVYSGKLDVANFIIKPDTMFKAEVECIACHNYEAYNSIMPSSKSCLDCHEEESYLKTYESWRKNTSEAVDLIEKWLIKNKHLKLTGQQKNRISWVKDILELVKTDDSKGVHNPKFFQSILEECKNSLSKIQDSGNLKDDNEKTN